jgi:hypothetical protein
MALINNPKIPLLTGYDCQRVNYYKVGFPFVWFVAGLDAADQQQLSRFTKSCQKPTGNWQI